MTDLKVPLWHVGEDRTVAPANAIAEDWSRAASYSLLQKLIRALTAVPGSATGSFEAEGKIYQILTFDAEQGKSVVMRPIREGEREEAVEQRVAEVVHDLNSPLSALRLRLAGLRRDEDLSAEATAALIESERDIERLQGIIKDAAALRVLSTKTLERELVSVASLLRTVRNAMLPLAERRNVAIRADWSDDSEAADRSIFVDRSWFERALINLADNAIRHSPEGGSIILAARLDASAENGPYWHFSVTDEGHGISPEALSGLKIGDVQSIAGAKGLSGLGLALVRRIASAHNGDLEVTSEVDSGSTFTISIPEASELQ